ncbi:MAG: hypothetical protein HWQ43_12780 [Nostoc sp. JL31]|uniref:hypothetical protein n=2 Tax=unclassified Nostoc TaxID=2593658 RepID=UPI0025DDE8F7|nr:hypothetical protein [Nostoc sp. JL31]MBN3890000.1 hypothetical protein [Nostoc sp. JL31]
MSQIIDEVKKLKLLPYKGFSLSDRVVKKMDKVELTFSVFMSAAFYAAWKLKCQHKQPIF